MNLLPQILFFAVFLRPSTAKFVMTCGAVDKDFKCDDNSTIPSFCFCDGSKNCKDGSDEKRQNLTFDPLSDWQNCVNAENDHEASCTVKRELICKQKVVCTYPSLCDLKCNSHYKCQSSGECVARRTVCNEKSNDGCSEDHGWKNGVGFKCLRDGRECVLPQQLLHDDLSDCDGGADVCFGFSIPLNASSRNERQYADNLIREKCFQCLNGVTLIPTSRVCDGVIDCDDLSDECLCEGEERPEICDKVIQHGQMTKRIGKDNSNTDGVSINHPNPARVISRRDVSNDTFLDGDPDESFSGYSGYVYSGYGYSGNADNDSESSIYEETDEDPVRQVYVECNTGYVQCENGSCIPRSSICDGVKDCDDDEKFDYCRGTINCKDADRHEQVCRCAGGPQNSENHYGEACNGVADCPIYFQISHIRVTVLENSSPEDECEANCESTATNFTCKPPKVNMTGFPLYCSFSCNDPLKSLEGNITDKGIILFEQKCDGIKDCTSGSDEFESVCPHRFPCDAVKQGYVSIMKHQTCDGYKDCKDFSDETEELCGGERFRCRSLSGRRVSIAQRLVCDMMPTCDNGEDEMNCTDGRFYCENGDPLFVKNEQKFDGRGDCSDWSDECPSIGSKNVFSSRDELIANPILRALVWIMGLFAICGNIIVLYIETKQLKKRKRLTAVSRANRLLILNLAASDIIMGIYLISLGIAGASFKGEYCENDLQWRSSSSCVGLGVLSVLSSETSVITMVLLTCCRLYAVLRPFKSSTHPQKKTIALMILSAWSAALTLALLPLAPQLSWMFITHAEFEQNPYFRNLQTPLDDAREVFNRLITYDLKTNVTVPDEFSADHLSWRELESTGREIFVRDHFKILKLFGYYSTDSVCIPKFFVSTSDRAWIFSFFVTFFNFCAFLFVTSSYIVIYLQSRKKSAMLSSTRGKNSKDATSLQRKILRLIITDFCCWVPICILAFIKLGGVNMSNAPYVVSAIVLLPINSSLNPLLYSNLPDLLYEKITRKFKSVKTHSESSNTRTTTGSNHDGTRTTAL